MKSLSFVMINESQSLILDYLQKCDLNVEKAANLFLNQQQPQPLQVQRSSALTKRDQIINTSLYKDDQYHKHDNVLQSYFKSQNHQKHDGNQNPIQIPINIHNLLSNTNTSISPSTIINEDDQNDISLTKTMISTPESSQNHISSQITKKNKFDHNLLIGPETKLCNNPLTPNLNYDKNKNAFHVDDDDNGHPQTPHLSSTSDTDLAYSPQSICRSFDFRSYSSTSNLSETEKEKENLTENANQNRRRSQRKRKRTRNEYENDNKNIRRRSPRILRIREQNKQDSDYDGSEEYDEELSLTSSPNKKRKYDESEALSMIMDILNDKPEGMRRYQLLVQLQRDNNDIKWSESFAHKIGEFNEFVKKHEKLSIFKENERNFGVMTSKRYMTMLTYRHQLYESDDDSSNCCCHI